MHLNKDQSKAMLPLVFNNRS